MSRNVHVYAGTAGHSMWFSEDAGASWVHPNSHSGLYLEARVWTIATHPATPDRLYVGTDMGVFRWDERTARFSLLPSPLQDVWALIQHPAHPERLYAGTRPAALYRSDDAGATWRKLEVPGLAQFSPVNMGPTRVTQLLVDPVDGRTLWACVEIGGIFRSDDDGETWVACSTGLVSDDVHGIAAIRSPDGSKRVFATTNRGLNVSDDNGAHWTFQRLDSPWQYTRAIVPSASGDGTLYLANGNGPPGNDGRLLCSRDSGSTWQDLGLPAGVNSTPWCIATNPADPRLLIVCTNLGQVFRSDDAGAHWERLAHEFGELRALAWRPLPDGTREQPHSITRAVVKAAAAA